MVYVIAPFFAPRQSECPFFYIHLVYGILYIVYGILYMVLVYGIWYIVYSILFMVYISKGYIPIHMHFQDFFNTSSIDFLIMVYGISFMVYGLCLWFIVYCIWYMVYGISLTYNLHPNIFLAPASTYSFHYGESLVYGI